MDGGALRVAMSVGPDLGQRVGLRDEGIVLGNRTVGIDANHLADMAAEVLGGVELETVAQGDEQLAVGAEGKTRSVMKVSFDLGVLPENNLHVVEAGLAELPAAHGRSVTAFAAFRIGEIDQLI